MRNKIQYIIPFILALTVYNLGYTQLNNSFFFQDRKAHSIGNLELYVENLNFFRNTEYNGKIGEGSTLFGYQFSPQLNYKIHENISFEGGIWLHKDFGNQNYFEILPVYRAIMEYGNNTFIVGSLFGSNQHGMVEPLFSPELVVNNRTEEGLQYILSKSKFHMDAWIDWQKMIYRDSPFREEFVVGVCSEWWPIKKTNFETSFPIQVLIMHKGGEIDQSGEGVVSQFNFSYGMNVTKKFKGKLKKIDFHGSLNYMEEPSNEPEYFIDGLGQLALLGFHWRKWGVYAQYWDAHEFFAPMGDEIYQSISQVNPDKYLFRYRKMTSLRAYFQQQLADDLNFLFRVHTTYDMNESNVNFIGELYLRWNPNFKLATIKSNKSN